MLPSRPIEIDQRFYIATGREQSPDEKTLARASYDPEPRGWTSYLDIIAILVVGGGTALVLLLRWLF